MAEPIAGGPGGARGSVPWLTLGCALALLAVFGVQLAYPAPTAQARLILLGANCPGLVGDGEWYRLATASLLHAGLQHVALNAISLMVIGSYLETVLGRPRLAVVLLASAFSGALASTSLGGLRVSVGASTAVAGLVGALFWLFVRRRNELLPGWRLPGALAVLFVMADFGFPSDPAIDSMAHIGGLSAGVFATGLLLRGAPLARLPARPGWVALGALFVLALAFSLGVAQGAWRVASGDRSSLFRQAEFVLSERGGDVGEVNNLVYLLANQPDASVPVLRLALERLSAAVVEHPELQELQDTLAAVHYRLGDYDQAIAAARAALAGGASIGYSTRLVWLESVREERLGALRVGHGSELEVDLVPHDEELAIRFERRTRVPTTVHVLLREDGRLHGLIELHVAPGVDAARVDLPPSLGASRSFTLALVDTRSAGEESALRLLAYDAALVPALPPPVAGPAPR